MHLNRQAAPTATPVSDERSDTLRATALTPSQGT